MQLCSRIRVERIRLPLLYRKKNTRTTSKQKYTTHDLKKNGNIRQHKPMLNVQLLFREINFAT